MQKPQLFLFHFAGGNSYSYNFLTPLLIHHFEVHTLELPGRGKRMGEALIKDCMLACNDLYDQLKSILNTSEYLIYGHSMGAILAFLVAEKMEQEMRAPTQLIITGNPGPGIKDKYRHNLPAELFVQELKQLGGVPNEFFEHEELFNLYEPILRADFEVVEKNHQALTTFHIKTPIYAMMGTNEESVEHIGNWKKYTTGLYQEKLLSGDHFFIHHHPNELANIIKNCYDRRKALPYSSF